MQVNLNYLWIIFEDITVAFKMLFINLVIKSVQKQ